ncbi:MAG: hypothetical protein V4591_11070 [Bdellovibrionota bacterium]
MKVSISKYSANYVPTRNIKLPELKIKQPNLSQDEKKINYVDLYKEQTKDVRWQELGFMRLNKSELVTKLNEYKLPSIIPVKLAQSLCNVIANRPDAPPIGIKTEPVDFNAQCESFMKELAACSDIKEGQPLEILQIIWALARNQGALPYRVAAVKEECSAHLKAWLSDFYMSVPLDSFKAGLEGRAKHVCSSYFTVGYESLVDKLKVSCSKTVVDRETENAANLGDLVTLPKDYANFDYFEALSKQQRLPVNFFPSSENLEEKAEKLAFQLHSIRDLRRQLVLFAAAALNLAVSRPLSSKSAKEQYENVDYSRLMGVRQGKLETPLEEFQSVDPEKLKKEIEELDKLISLQKICDDAIITNLESLLQDKNFFKYQREFVNRLCIEFLDALHALRLNGEGVRGVNLDPGAKSMSNGNAVIFNTFLNFLYAGEDSSPCPQNLKLMFSQFGSEEEEMKKEMSSLLTPEAKKYVSELFTEACKKKEETTKKDEEAKERQVDTIRQLLKDNSSLLHPDSSETTSSFDAHIVKITAMYIKKQFFVDADQILIDKHRPFVNSVLEAKFSSELNEMRELEKKMLEETKKIKEAEEAETKKEAKEAGDARKLRMDGVIVVNPEDVKQFFKNAKFIIQPGSALATFSLDVRAAKMAEVYIAYKFGFAGEIEAIQDSERPKNAYFFALINKYSAAVVKALKEGFNAEDFELLAKKMGLVKEERTVATQSAGTPVDRKLEFSQDSDTTPDLGLANEWDKALSQGCTAKELSIEDMEARLKQKLNGGDEEVRDCFSGYIASQLTNGFEVIGDNSAVLAIVYIGAAVGYNFRKMPEEGTEYTSYTQILGEYLEKVKALIKQVYSKEELNAVAESVVQNSREEGDFVTDVVLDSEEPSIEVMEARLKQKLDEDEVHSLFSDFSGYIASQLTNGFEVIGDNLAALAIVYIGAAVGYNFRKMPEEGTEEYASYAQILGKYFKEVKALIRQVYSEDKLNDVAEFVAQNFKEEELDVFGEGACSNTNDLLPIAESEEQDLLLYQTPIKAHRRTSMMTR